ncbi:amino acid ABC transporter permease [Candidatus Dependentiae bacterium]|nr:amino acid ABC transporter permease [Candidatus Dependentiae bacterium]
MMLSNSITMIVDAAPLLLQGTLMTLQLWVCATLISLSSGILLGVLRSAPTRVPLLSRLLDVITFMFRGIPFYVQLLIAYFVLPELIGINLSAQVAGVITLGLCSAAYISQIIRGGINAVPKGQWEAAQVLGYTTPAAIRYVILPQIVRSVVPACAGELDQLLKSTSVISAIGVLEITGAAKNIIAREMNPLTMYATIAVVYLLFSTILTGVSAALERKVTL